MTLHLSVICAKLLQQLWTEEASPTVTLKSGTAYHFGQTVPLLDRLSHNLKNNFANDRPPDDCRSVYNTILAHENALKLAQSNWPI